MVSIWSNVPLNVRPLRSAHATWGTIQRMIATNILEGLQFLRHTTTTCTTCIVAKMHSIPINIENQSWGKCWRCVSHHFWRNGHIVFGRNIFCDLNRRSFWIYDCFAHEPKSEAGELMIQYLKWSETPCNRLKKIGVGGKLYLIWCASLDVDEIELDMAAILRLKRLVVSSEWTGQWKTQSAHF